MEEKLVKKIIWMLSIFLIIFSSWVFFTKLYYNPEKIDILENNIKLRIKYTGFNNGHDLAIDENGNFYIGLNDRIQYIDTEGESYLLVKDESLSINSLEYNNKHLYYSSKNKIFDFDIVKKTNSVLINDLPNYGDYGESIIKAKDNMLYISIGAATNSGVVGSDNKWLRNYPYNYDLSPKDLILKGMNFGKDKTGAFLPNATKSSKTQKISAHFPANATIIRKNLSNAQNEGFAWGIRNVKGMDFDVNGKLFATIGGMEERGLRPIKFDTDYIFEIKQNLWYGWPDFSGGDAINSPRFKGSSNVLLLDNPPSVNPPAPVLQNKYLSSLGSLAIDRTGVIGEANAIYYYDEKTKTIYQMNSQGAVKGILRISLKNKIISMKFTAEGLVLLEGGTGYIIEAYK